LGDPACRTLYLAHRGKLLEDGRRWEDAIVDDYREFRSAVLTDQMMAEIEKELLAARPPVRQPRVEYRSRHTTAPTAPTKPQPWISTTTTRPRPQSWTSSSIKPTLPTVRRRE